MKGEMVCTLEYFKLSLLEDENAQHQAKWMNVGTKEQAIKTQSNFIYFVYFLRNYFRNHTNKSFTKFQFHTNKHFYQKYL